jgi:hypothetical protein
MEKDVIRIVSPRDKLKFSKKVDQEEPSKLVTVHSLDIVSRIKTPKEPVQNEERSSKVEGRSSKVEEVNITFNCNDFAVADSKAASGLARKRWR